MASLSQVLDRLEEGGERQKGVLQQRIDAERAELKATMSFSRAAAVASVEQEVELREAREAKAAARDEKASAPVECSSPELAREDGDTGHGLADEKARLEEEVTALRVQVERLSVASAGGGAEGGAASAPGSPADGQRPAVVDEKTVPAVANDKAAPTVADDKAVPEVVKEKAVPAAKKATSSESNGDDAPDEDAGDGSSSGRSGGEGGGLTRRLVEAETERVLAELRANPPASTKALMLARAELDARATEVVAKLNATGLLPPPPPLPSALHEDLGL